MIKQFNFFDIYGDLLPGMLLVGLLWIPCGVLTNTWPDQDLSKALFLGVLAYIVGHLIQTVALSVVPSKVTDKTKHLRSPSDLLLDGSDKKFAKELKEKLAAQVKKLFGIDLEITKDGDGENDISKKRQDAFFQARTYLITKNAARYAEQFEGLYAMMRGLGCSFFAGGSYLAGWALSFHRDCFRLSDWMPVVLWIAIAASLICALIAYFNEPARKKVDRFLTWSIVVALFGAGFLAGLWRYQAAGISIPAYAEYILWGSWLLAWIAAARCFSAYKGFAQIFAETVWRDFSAYLSFQGTPARPVEDSSDGS
ncbi:MAG: hypothetical protein ABSC48_19100 [Terracidiphilus sp.]